MLMKTFVDRPVNNKLFYLIFYLFLTILYIIIKDSIEELKENLKTYDLIVDENKTKFQWKNKTYYITSSIKNLKNVEKYYFSELKKLVKILGPNNLIISIVENGDSEDGTKDKLIELQKYLNENKVRNKIYLERIVERKQFNHKSGKNYDKIAYYADLRNKGLDYLYEIKNIDFDNTLVIFLNDIVFTAEDVLRLIYTNYGDYDAVCAMDFFWKGFYDRWVTFDYLGKSPGKRYPYFKNKNDRKAVIKGEPLQVFSCWNGMVIYSGKVFKDKKIKFRYTTFAEAERKHEFLRGPHKFGYESECTLFNVDLYLNGFKKVLINPQVRVAYDEKNYLKNKFIDENEKTSNFSTIYVKKLWERNKKTSEPLKKWISENKKLE